MRVRAILTGLLLAGAVTVATARTMSTAMPSMAIPADTTKYGEDTLEDEEGGQTQETKLPPRDVAKGSPNALDYVMESRYRPTGDTFIKKPKWLRNMYVQGGVGAEMITPPDKVYKLSPLAYAQIGIGRDFSKLHSARLLFHGATGYLRTKELTMTKLGVKLEYMYNLSSYFSGYNPARLFGLSLLLGAGAQYSKIETQSATSFEGHVGLQARFYTGPKAYISLEPYVGVAGDNVDLSEKRNWRKADIFYGANLNLVYYLGNNLSPEAKRRLIAKRNQHNQLSPDSLLESWQKPWFVQITNGVSVMNSPALSQMNTMGSELSLSLGRWLSPVVGLRGSVYSRDNIWRKVHMAAAEGATSTVEMSMHNQTMGVRLEAMINPLGFLNNFYWDAPFGFYLVGGAEYGWVKKTQSTELSCSMFGWGGGINLWYQLSPGLKVFLEPRIMHNEYKIPYTNVDWNKRYSDNYMTLNLGLAVEMRDDDRYYLHNYESEYVTNRLRKITVGLGGGTHFMQLTKTYSIGTSMGYNGMLFGEYHFDRLKSVRLGVEFIGMKRASETAYIDYNMDYPDQGNAPVERTGMWNHKYQFILASLGGMLDLNYVARNFHPQKLRLYVFAGPTVAYVLKYTRELSELERLKLNHKVEPVDADKVGMSFGAHLGLKLQYAVNNKIGIFLTPTVYWMGNAKMPGIDFTNMKLMETVNLGAQYSF